MNYEKIYEAIVVNRINNEITDGYFETHHIIPKCLGGEDEDWNLIKLTAREHFLCHYLLMKIYEDTTDFYKLVKAFYMMRCTSENQKRYLNSRLYEAMKHEFSKAQSLSQTGKGNSQYGTCWVYNESSQESIKIPKTQINWFLSEGWIKGRKINWGLTKTQKNKLISEKRKLKKKEERKKLAYKLYDEYKKSGCTSIREFVREGHYNKSHVSLTKLFNEYVPK